MRAEAADAPRPDAADARTPPVLVVLGLLGAVAVQLLCSGQGTVLLKDSALHVVEHLEAILRSQIPHDRLRSQPVPTKAPPTPYAELQPDEIRLMAPSGADDLRCGWPVPPESISTTRGVGLDGAASVTVFVRSGYRVREEKDGNHEFTYTVELTNDGAVPVQLLARHWVFTDDAGKVREVKGPGARGHQAKLAPGARLEYQSSVHLSTPRGSMHGSFQFEQLSGGGGPEEDEDEGAKAAAEPQRPVASFNVAVGRLALSRDGRAEDVACVPENVDRLPPTSVGTAHRLGVGVTVKHAPERSDPDLGKFVFTYTVTFSNSRDEPIALVGHEWTTIDRNGVQQHVRGGGLGGDNNIGKVKLQPSQILSYQGSFELPTRTGNAEGLIAVSLAQDDETLYHVPINPMGLAVDDEPVAPIKPLSFLAALGV